jgi:hypothetical protein
LPHLLKNVNILIMFNKFTNKGESEMKTKNSLKQKRLGLLLILAIFTLVAVTACNNKKKEVDALAKQLQEMKDELNKAKEKASADEIARLEKVIAEQEEKNKSAAAGTTTTTTTTPAATTTTPAATTTTTTPATTTTTTPATTTTTPAATTTTPAATTTTPTATPASEFKMTGTTIASFIGSSKNVVIPGTVTSIGKDAFAEKTITSVIIPTSVTSIGSGAFSSSGLTTVTIPKGVTSIGASAFAECKSLASATISESVTSIGRAAFWSDAILSVTFQGAVPANGFNNDASYPPFQGDLRAKYLEGGAGTYTRTSGSKEWTKK